jgi:acyl-CoA thioester hydrolase
MYSHKTKIRVRYSETDQMGYVHHGNYAQFFEIGRLEWLRSLGISYSKMEKNGVMLPVYSLNTRFIKPAFYDQELTIVTRLKKTPSVRIEFYYEIFNDKEEKITTGETTLVFIAMKTGKPIKCPDAILEVIEKANPQR